MLSTTSNYVPGSTLATLAGGLALGTGIGFLFAGVINLPSNDSVPVGFTEFLLIAGPLLGLAATGIGLLARVNYIDGDRAVLAALGLLMLAGARFMPTSWWMGPLVEAVGVPAMRLASGAFGIVLLIIAAFGPANALR